MESYDSAGPVRAARIELVKTVLKRNGQSVQEGGVLFGLRRETESHGAFSLEGAIREGGDGVLTAWQRNLAFDGGWFANNGLGMLNTPSVELVRRQYRFYVPTMAMLGASTEWANGPGTQLSAGVGQPGVYTGIRVPTFERLPGTVFSAGAQTALAPNVQVGIQAVGANGIKLGGNLDDRGPELSTTGAIASTAWSGAGASIQANVIAVNSNLLGTHSGGWVDGWFRGDQVDHNAGVFRFEPGLLWGNQQIVSDLQGVYYRANFQSRQWQLDGGLDYATPVSGAYGGTLYATGSARYQASRDWGVGGGANVRQGPVDAWSTFSFVDHLNGWGSARAQVNYAQDPTRHATQLTVDQTWRLRQSFRLSTTASVLRESGDLGSFNNVGLAVYGGGDLGNNLTLDGNIQWNSQAGLTQGASTYANVALNWRFAPSWTLSAYVYQNNTSALNQLVVNSPIGNPALSDTQRLNDRGVFLSLRYEFSAGASSAPLGGRPNDGAGHVSGTLYLDQNDDGRMDAGERGAPNLTVVLDGKFVTRTDASGRFEFAQVVAGRHVITVLPDNLPLPWKLKNEGRQEFNVDVRGSTVLEIGAFPMR